MWNRVRFGHIGKNVQRAKSSGPCVTDCRGLFDSAKCVIPHPYKEHFGGEDAAFCTDRALGVADGVGSWESVGIDAGLYSKELLRRVEEIYTHGLNNKEPLPARVLKKAYLDTLAIGTSTVCLVFLDEAESCLHTANLGDSGFLVYRPKLMEVTYKSEPQLHTHNCPFQMGTGSHDLPEHADYQTVKIKTGDWVMLATDGVWDNLYPSDIITALRTTPSPQVAAQQIAAQAQIKSQNPRWRSPYSESRRAYGDVRAVGGKVDDISVIVARILEPSPRISSPKSDEIQ
eukprot:Platyproteum_vivax@DN4170_c0_g1_i1.p1